MKLYNKINGEELKQKMLESDEARITLSFYQYAHIEHPQQFRDELYKAWFDLGVFGRVYVAAEGINAQISVSERTFEDFKTQLNSIDFLKGVRLNIAIEDDGKSFYKLKIKVRPKIVADGLDDSSFDVTKRGTHLTAEEFNQLTEDPETIIVDMRNHYESEVGYFENALIPDVETFREALPTVEDMLKNYQDRKIIMYCTGGIRCEKASAYYKHRGFKNVFQLEGGIIEYARQAEQKGLNNKFKGKNFVFDERMGERIGEEIISKCHQCGTACDTHVNCANDACHILFIQCESCAEKYHACCSTKCSDFSQLPKDVQKKRRKDLKFNGTKFGKGRYKAFKQEDGKLLND